MPSPQLTPFRKITALRSVLLICVPFSNSRHAAFVCSFYKALCGHQHLRDVFCPAMYCYARNVARACSCKRNYKLQAWRLDNLTGTHSYLAARQDFSGKPSCLNWAQSPAHCGHINITLGKKNSSRQVHSTNRGIRENYL